MSERRLESVRILLRTLNDIYPGPTTLKQTPASGAAPSKRVPCDLCHKSGRAYSRVLRTVTVCPLCDGTGWRRRRKGDAAWDEYLGQEIATVEQPKRAEPMSPQRLETELAHIRHDLMMREGIVDPHESYGWERERARRDQDASYRELERALDVMQIEFPVGRSLITDYYLGGLADGSKLPQWLDDRLIGWIADRMPRRIRIPHRIHKQQQEERRVTIRKLAKDGVGEEEIAERMECSRKFVRAVIADTLQVSAGAAVISRPSV